jgi:prolyl-tRNA editing enzyme YbaK/EbsC (Cys-tRNA(Pro) deacylase)
VAKKVPEFHIATRAGVASTGGQAGRRPRISAVTVVLACCAAAGLLLRGYQLTRPGYLLGVTEYDDGVMFGNALRLVSGSIPYRDFQMVHPPGSMFILAPAALLAKVIGTAQGMAIVRVSTVGADVANIALIGVLIRQRGLLAVGIACGVYAVYPDALVAAHTFMLEPWLNLCCLIAAVLLFGSGQLAGAGQRSESPVERRPWLSDNARFAGAGLAFGFGAAVKIWAAVPCAIAALLLVISGFLAAPSLLPASARDLWTSLRPAAILTGGAALGLGVPLLPFAIMAPGSLLRSVLIGQLVRNWSGQRDPLARLDDMAGLQTFPGKLPNQTVLVVFALVMLTCYAWVCLTAQAGRLRLGPAWLDAYALTSAIATTVMLLWPALYYPHYGAFAGPFIGLAVALPTGLLATGRPAARRGPAETAAASRSPLAAGVATVLAVALALDLARATETQLRLESRSRGDRVAVAADRLIPAGTCALTNHASYAVAADRFFSASPDCPLMVDSFGTLFAMTSGGSIGSSRSALQPVRELWMSSLVHAQYFWVTEDTTQQIPWDSQLLGYFNAHYRLIGLSRKTTLQNRATPEPGIYRHVWSASRPGRRICRTARAASSSTRPAGRPGRRRWPSRCARAVHATLSRMLSLTLRPALSAPELLAAPVAAALRGWPLAGEVQAAAIDPALADTAAFCERYGVPLQESANCVIIAAKRGGETTYAACVVAATTRADVNGLVRRHLGARKASFGSVEAVTAATGMEYGGITPIGLPAQWPVLVDAAVAKLGSAVIGAGIRGAKLWLPGGLLAEVPGAEVIEGLGVPVTAQVDTTEAERASLS